jgi:beta-lactamase regulating signal transducer with metallopeptidase domain
MIDTIHMGVVAEVALKTLIASGVTLGALRLMANRTAAERSFVAHLGLAATLAIPFAALVMPSLAFSEQFDWLCTIIAPSWLYAIPAALLVGVTAVAVWRLFGLRRRATVLVEPAWLGALAHAQRRMGFKSGAALLVSPDIASPVSWGLFRPTIVLDERALQAKSEAEAIIAHELAHVARADWAKLLLSRAATALFWFNPLVWLLARQCHELREEAADDAVLCHEVDGSDYAAILVGHARHECRGLLLAANGVAPGKGSLRRRVTRVLDGKLRRAPAGLGFTAAAFLIALAAGTPLAALTLRAPHPVAPAAPVQPVAPIRVAVDMGDGGHTYATITPRTATTPSLVRAVVTDEAGKAVSTATVPVPARQAEPPAKPRFTAGELIAMSQQGVTPQWLREMAALGYTNLSGGEITALAVQGVDAAYVRGLSQAGYPHLSAGQIIAMRVQGVSPDYVRQITRAGGPRPTPEQLVALQTQGVSAELIRAAAEARVSAELARSEAFQMLREMKLSRSVDPPLPPPPTRRTLPKAPAAPANEDD